MRNERPSRAGRLAARLIAALAALSNIPAAVAAESDADRGADRAADRGAEARSTAASLARIENETLLLKAEERQMAVRLQLAAQRNDLAQRHAQTRLLERPARAGDPTVIAVEGIGRQRYATLMMDNGGLLEARIGDVLPNGMTLLSVRAGEVVVGRGRKEHIRLAHGAQPAPATPGADGVPAPAPRTAWTLPPLPTAPAMAVMAGQGATR